MATVIRDNNLTIIVRGVKPDSKRRVVLPKVVVSEDITYHMYCNSLGQIVLDPQVTVPVSEAWLFNNPDALALVRRGLSDAAEGRVSKINLDTL